MYIFASIGTTSSAGDLRSKQQTLQNQMIIAMAWMLLLLLKINSYERSHTLIQEVPAMRIRPLHDRILIERVEEEEKTKGGIIIPDTAKEKPMQGKVIAVGKGKVTEKGQVTALDVEKGNRILFSKYSGTEVKIDGKEHLIIREDDILGVIEE